MACASASRARAREVLPNGLLRSASLIVVDMGLFVLVAVTSAGFSEVAPLKLLFPVAAAVSLAFSDPLLSLRGDDVTLGTEGDMSCLCGRVHGRM